MDRTIIVTPYKDPLFILVPACFTTGTVPWRHHIRLWIFRLIFWARLRSCLTRFAAVLLNCVSVPCNLRISGHRMIRRRRDACLLTDLTALPMCDWNSTSHEWLLFLKVCVRSLAVALRVDGYYLISRITYSVSSFYLWQGSIILLFILKVILFLT